MQVTAKRGLFKGPIADPDNQEGGVEDLMGFASLVKWWLVVS